MAGGTASSGPISGPQIDWRAIPGTDMEGAVYRGLIYVRGPCGQHHAVSPAQAHHLADWLLDRTAIDGTAEDVTAQRAVGFT